MFAVSPAGYHCMLTGCHSSRYKKSTVTGLARSVNVLAGERLIIMIFMN